MKKMLGLKSVEEARGRIIEHKGRRYLSSFHPAVRFYREDLAKKPEDGFCFAPEGVGEDTRERKRWKCSAAEAVTKIVG